MNINNFGLLLSNVVNKTGDKNSNKNKLFAYIYEYRKEQENKHDKRLENKEYYITNFDNKRRDYANIYNDYFYNRLDLYNQWKMSKNVGDLHKLVSLNVPKLDEIPDIYTSDISRNKNFKR